MTEPITASQFYQAEGVEDWRLTSEGATAFFRTRSFAESARFVQAISELLGIEDHHPGVSPRRIRTYEQVDYGLIPKFYFHQYTASRLEKSVP